LHNNAVKLITFFYCFFFLLVTFYQFIVLPHLNPEQMCLICCQWHNIASFVTGYICFYSQKKKDSYLYLVDMKLSLGQD